MLVNNVNGERVGASMVKNSSFYIEIAKFVQAYTTIVSNPNEFLNEVKLPLIDEEKEVLKWNQFVTIMQNCDLGFKEKPTETELVVYYNYAFQIGSLDSVTKRIASVDEIADAQKHYYNFVDEAADRAETEYLKYHRVALSRERELKNADNNLLLIKTGNIVSSIFMMLAVFCIGFGITSLFLENMIANAVGSIIPVWKSNYVGGILFILIGIIMFIVFDLLFVKTKHKYFDLKLATAVIFKRSDETFKFESILKTKLDKIQKDLKTVQEELADKNKTFDVKHNIEVLKSTNKFYVKLCEPDEEYAQIKGTAKNLAGDDSLAMADEEFAPVKLTKDQEENLHTVSREAINLEGVFDEEAYNEKFEKSQKHEKAEDKEANEKQPNEKTQEQAEQEQQQKLQQDQELLDSIDYIKDILGFGSDDEISRQK